MTPQVEPNPKKRKPKTKSATVRADKFFSLLVRSRGRCENCGSYQDLQCAHGFSRRYRNVRWEFANAWCLCKGCHLKYTMRPLEWDDWMQQRLHHVPGWSYLGLRNRALSPEKLVDVKERAAELEAAWKAGQ